MLCFALDPPLKNFSQPNVVAQYNQTVNISCDVCANPPPEKGAYAWIVNGSIILNQVNVLAVLYGNKRRNTRNMKYSCCSTHILFTVLLSWFVNLESTGAGSA